MANPAIVSYPTRGQAPEIFALRLNFAAICIATLMVEFKDIFSQKHLTWRSGKGIPIASQGLPSNELVEGHLFSS